MTAQVQQRIEVAAYLAQERANDQRREYYDGHIITLAGGSEAHSLIIVNIAASLHSQLR